MFDCEVIALDSGISVRGSSDSIRMSEDVLRAMDRVLGKKEQLDILSVRYLCLLEKDNLLEDFMDDEDPVILTTPAGRSVRAKTLGQRVYVDAMSKNDVVICKGPAGSGKTFLGVAMAVLALRERSVSRIILTRPAVEAGEKLGYLPGDIEEKVDPYMRPIYDALLELMGREGFERNMERGIIEVSPLAYMRGRNLDDSFILLDEAQNTTIEQMMMFLTRMGMNSRVCVCGDTTQIDLPSGYPNGLDDAMRILRDISGISTVSLHETDIVRNPLVQKIIMAYNARERRQGGHA
ncbi:MAG: PhoH family protein [Clostridiales bacterium]|nr:PhoH family protein [Clostridiales bacterium]